MSSSSRNKDVFFSFYNCVFYLDDIMITGLIRKKEHSTGLWETMPCYRHTKNTGYPQQRNKKKKLGREPVENSVWRIEVTFLDKVSTLFINKEKNVDCVNELSFRLQVEHLQKSLDETHSMINKLQAMLASRTELNQKLVSFYEF